MITLAKPIKINQREFSRIDGTFYNSPQFKKNSFLSAGMRRPLILLQGDNYNPDLTMAEAVALVQAASGTDALQACFSL